MNSLQKKNTSVSLAVCLLESLKALVEPGTVIFRKWLIGFVGFAVPTACLFAQDSVFSDGDFESPPKHGSSSISFITGSWFVFYNKCEASQASVSLDSAQKHGGESSVSVRGVTQPGGSAGIAHEAAVYAGEKYELSFWYRTDLTKGNAVLLVTHLKEKTRVEIPASGEWKEFKYAFTIEFPQSKTEGTISVRLGLFNADMAGQVWFDDVVLRKLP